MKTLKAVIAAVLLMTFSGGCDKKDKDASMTVLMKDAPAKFSNIFVEVLAVEVHYSGGGWATLHSNTGIYDLLTLRNDVTAVIADEGSLPAGHVTQMRLILGENNTAVEAGISYNLVVPSAMRTGIKINIDAEIRPGTRTAVVLDFDGAASLTSEPDGSIRLSPVIKVESVVQTDE